MVNKVIGRKIGPFQLQEKIGSGGMATVYKAVHKDSMQAIALKVLHEQHSDNPKIRQRFEREAKISSQLEHRHIVPILDLGEFKGQVYLVMPFMEGGSLAGSLSEKISLHYSSSLEILSSLADALDYAHSRGVIHRDFKLENILTDKLSIPAISDFGIAQIAEATNITLTSQILGTPLYFAPENFAGTETGDYRLDLYAFAVTAYLMFTGYFPFTGSNALSIIDKHKYAELPLPGKINPQLPPALDEIFFKAMAKEPDKRFSSAREFVSELDRVFATIPAGAARIFLNEENPAGLSTETPSSIQQALNAAESDKTVPPVVPFYKNLLPGNYRKFATPVLLGGVLSACLVLSAGAQYMIPSFNPQSANYQLEEFKAGQTLSASQTLASFETEVPTSTIMPTVSPSSTKPASESQSEPLSVPTGYGNFSQGLPAENPPLSNQGVVPSNLPANNPPRNNQQPTNPPATEPAPVDPPPNNPPPNNPQPTNRPQNNPRPTNPPPTDDNGGSGGDGGSGGSGGSGRDGGSGRGNGNGNSNGRGNGRGGSG